MMLHPWVGFAVMPLFALANAGVAFSTSDIQPVTVAIFVALAKGDTMRLDAVRLQIDGQLVAHYIYSAKELQALHKGGVQRIYVGNVATGDHKLDVLVDGKLEGADFSRTREFAFRKEVKPKLVGLTLAGPHSGNTPIALGEW